MAVRPPQKKITSKVIKKKISHSDPNTEAAWKLALKIYPDLVNLRALMSACNLELEREFVETLVNKKKFTGADAVATMLISRFLNTEFNSSIKLKNLILHSLKAKDGILFLIDFTPLVASLGLDSSETILRKVSENHLSFAKRTYHTFGFENCLPPGVLSSEEESRQANKIERARKYAVSDKAKEEKDREKRSDLIHIFLFIISVLFFLYLFFS
jgi:hypothetical protein